MIAVNSQHEDVVSVGGISGACYFFVFSNSQIQNLRYSP